MSAVRKARKAPIPAKKVQVAHIFLNLNCRQIRQFWPNLCNWALFCTKSHVLPRNNWQPPGVLAGASGRMACTSVMTVLALKWVFQCKTGPRDTYSPETHESQVYEHFLRRSSDEKIPKDFGEDWGHLSYNPTVAIPATFREKLQIQQSPAILHLWRA